MNVLVFFDIKIVAEQGGWLDFVYLDDYVRVTKGNKGGTFVHVREEVLEELKK